MTLSRAYVDGFLVEWEKGEYQAQVKMLRQRSQTIQPTMVVGNAGKARETTKRAQVIRDRLARTTRRVPEVMVKITSSGKGMKQVRWHIDYISRKGQIDLEDQDGILWQGKDHLRYLTDGWREDGPAVIPESGVRRETLNIVFSMPAHTNEVSLKRAVRDFARREFDSHPFVFAYHTQGTDPHPSPPAHPHIHLSVKMLGDRGQRLNPRKADLQRWREGFAAALRAHGIEANATSRLARLQPTPGMRRGQLALINSGRERGRNAPARQQNRSRAAKLEADRLAYYYAVSRVLARSEDPRDRSLAMDVARFLRPGRQREATKSHGHDFDPGIDR